MRFALINSTKTEAEPGLSGICPGCKAPVIAKCGTERIHHWAHARIRTCDNWWEPETEWHRNWKSNFLTEWQEVFLPDERTGEKHVADIQTSHGLVIEFQHSHINPDERKSREAFYKEMVWVVDGSRLKRDYSRFKKQKEDFHVVTVGLFRIDYSTECFPSSWLESSVPVLFDYGKEENNLYCVFPIVFPPESVFVMEFTREKFIELAIGGQWTELYQNIMTRLNRKKAEWLQIIENKKRRDASQMQNIFDRFARYSGARRRRRF